MSRWWIALGLAWMAVLNAVPAGAQVVEALGHKRGLLSSSPSGQAAPRARPCTIMLAGLSSEQFDQAFAPAGDDIIVTDERPYMHALGATVAGPTLEGPMPVAGGVGGTPFPAMSPVAAGDVLQVGQASQSLFGGIGTAPSTGGAPTAAATLLAVAGIAGVTMVTARRRRA